MSQASRPNLQDLVKAASAGVMTRVAIEEEARRQAGEPVEKTASDTTTVASKEYIDKLAHGLDWAAENLDKIAFEVGPGKGPGALPVSHATASTPLPDHKGQGHQQPPTHPGVEKARPSDAAGNALETNKASTPGHAPTKIASLAERNAERLKKLAGKDEPKSCEHCGKEKDACSCKTASIQKNLERLSKVAEDRINPAHISAGAAVPPETSMSGQPGGMPVGGKPGPGMDLASTTTGAIGYTKGQAKAGPKADLGKYFKEPALSGATDKTLAVAFDSTPKAGTKFASAGESTEQVAGEKVAAARAFVEDLLKGN